MRKEIDGQAETTGTTKRQMDSHAETAGSAPEEAVQPFARHGTSTAGTFPETSERENDESMGHSRAPRRFTSEQLSISR
jgi:hypothetical protein